MSWLSSGVKKLTGGVSKASGGLIPDPLGGGSNGILGMVGGSSGSSGAGWSSDYTKAGLGSAQGQMNALNKWRPQQVNNPAQAMQFVGNKPYQSLTGGDYDKLQQSYSAPVEQAYNQGVGQTKSIFGANGMYGSVGGSGGLMSGALSQQNQARMMGLNDATARRYSTQLQDSQFGYQSGVADAARRQDFDTRRALLGYQHGMDQRSFDLNLMKDRFNAGMSLGTGAMPAWQTTQQANSANQAGWLGAAGSIGGGLMGNWQNIFGK